MIISEQDYQYLLNDLRASNAHVYRYFPDSSYDSSVHAYIVLYYDLQYFKSTFEILSQIESIE